MKNRITYIVVEDVDLQREELIRLLGKRLDLECIGSFDNAESAYAFWSDQSNPKPDLVFLDIEMPEVNGIELLEAVKRFRGHMRVIITSAFPEYAVSGYEYEVSAYLLKPIEVERLNRAIDRVLQEWQNPTPPSPMIQEAVSRGHLMIREKNKWVKLDYEDILYLEGANVNVRIAARSRAYLTRERLKNMEQALPSDQFLRVHDSFIINLAYVRGYESNHTRLDLSFGGSEQPVEIPVGAKYREGVKRVLG